MYSKPLSILFRTVTFVVFLLFATNSASAQTLYATTTPNTGAGASALINVVLIAGCIAVLTFGSAHLRKAYQQA